MTPNQLRVLQENRKHAHAPAEDKGHSGAKTMVPGGDRVNVRTQVPPVGDTAATEDRRASSEEPLEKVVAPAR